MKSTEYRISLDTPFYYITAVAKDRLPVFRNDAIKEIACAALDEARRSGEIALFAYVIMPDHFHLIADGQHKSSYLLRFLKGIPAHRIISYLKEHDHQSSLEKLRHQERERQYKYSLWEHHSNVKPLTTESLFMQKVNYIHQNPVNGGLVERAEEYRWSSVRCWARCETDREPLSMDIDRIIWRKSSDWRRSR